MYTGNQLIVPHLRLAGPPPRSAGQMLQLDRWDWRDIPALPPLLRADGSGPATYQTAVRVCADSQALYVRFDCHDCDIWATFTQRDDPIYDEEVVEVFLSPGTATPTRYYEFEVSPAGVLLDARIDNSTTLGADIVVDTSWNCDGIRWQAGRSDAAHQWWAVLAIPWSALADASELPANWRANFYRIERPQGAQPEFSCWSPTMTDPADFHKPAYFGLLTLVNGNADH